MKKYLLALLFAVSSIPAQSQYDHRPKELRRMTLKSDVILAGSSNLNDIRIVNDHTSVVSYTFSRIDTMLVNVTGYRAEPISILQEFDDYPSYWDERAIYMEYYDGPHVVPNLWERYTNIHFIRKQGDCYVSVGAIHGVEWERATYYYFPAIRKLREIGDMTDLALRFERSVDWYIENNTYPDKVFFDFYLQEGIIQSVPGLNMRQYDRALELYMQGSEELLPFIEGRYDSRLEAYYIGELKRISAKRSPEWDDYRKFRNIVNKLLSLDYNTLDYSLMWLLIKDAVDSGEKKQIMEHFIRLAEQAAEQHSVQTDGQQGGN